MLQSAENLAELCCAAGWKAELVFTLGNSAEEISKHSVKGAALLFLNACPKMSEQKDKARKKSLSKKRTCVLCFGYSQPVQITKDAEVCSGDRSKDTQGILLKIVNMFQLGQLDPNKQLSRIQG